MGIETTSGDVYRLIVALDVRVVVAVGYYFNRFEQAQSQVASIVCRYAHTGRVRAIALQRGRPSAAPLQSGNGSPQRLPRHDNGYNWTIEKHWGAEVIRRILVQNGIKPQLAAPMPRLTAGTPPRPTVRRPKPRRGGEQHKSVRRHVTATVAVIILAMITLLLFQTGGHPHRLLSAITDTQPSVKDELPFDARTSFTPKRRPDVHEPPGDPDDEDSKPTKEEQPERDRNT